jgi:hypothetical protein
MKSMMPQDHTAWTPETALRWLREPTLGWVGVIKRILLRVLEDKDNEITRLTRALSDTQARLVATEEALQGRSVQ